MWMGRQLCCVCVGCSAAGQSTREVLLGTLLLLLLAEAHSNSSLIARAKYNIYIYIYFSFVLLLGDKSNQKKKILSALIIWGAARSTYR